MGIFEFPSYWNMYSTECFIWLEVSATVKKPVSNNLKQCQLKFVFQIYLHCKNCLFKYSFRCNGTKQDSVMVKRYQIGHIEQVLAHIQLTTTYYRLLFELYSVKM